VGNGKERRASGLGREIWEEEKEEKEGKKGERGVRE
jgi:hypothetical protein